MSNAGFTKIRYKGHPVVVGMDPADPRGDTSAWFLDIRELPVEDSNLPVICQILDQQVRLHRFRQPAWIWINAHQAEHVFSTDEGKLTYYRGIPLAQVRMANVKAIGEEMQRKGGMRDLS